MDEYAGSNAVRSVEDTESVSNLRSSYQHRNYEHRSRTVRLLLSRIVHGVVAKMVVRFWVRDGVLLRMLLQEV